MTPALVFSSGFYLLFAFLYLRVAAIQHFFYLTIVFFTISVILFIKEIAKPQTLTLEKTIDEVEEIKKITGSDKPKDGSKAEGLRKRKGTVEKHEGFEIHYESENKIVVKHYSGGSIFLKLLGVVIFVVFSFFLDLTLSPVLQHTANLTFIRPGYIGHDTAKISYRIPPVAFYENPKDFGDARDLSTEAMYIQYAPIKFKGQSSYPSSLKWIKTESLSTIGEASDFTGVYTISDLEPSSLYYIQVAQKNTNRILADTEFHTSPKPGLPTKLKFGSGSCIKPNFPYVPFSTPHLEGFRRMAKHDLDFVMFLGDFIYADSPYFFGSEVEKFRRLYRQVYSVGDTMELAKKSPMLHIYDDHEILDNWDNQNQHPYGNAIKAYWEYNGAANPDPPSSDALYYNFTYGNVAFYVWDTRGNRDNHKVENSPKKTMLGAKQKAHFFNWLRDVNHTAAVKFVASSVPLAYVWDCADAYTDIWGGFRHERAEILAETKYVPNLFFLSGDRHETAVVRLASDNIEFSTSPINQFSLPIVNQHIHASGGDITEYFLQPGQVKFGVLEVDTESDPDIPKVKYSLFTNNEANEKKPNYVYEAECVEWK
ncbi:hypothetical protein BB560_000573 [Smittium megazygosporum]|uniref:PhoD-like phosphatase metallophosphatase domain-containing protein n=1 Tax=Smittium megazygosporum TaxID=133381 RepID=A0A2T9ZJW7_9FUNG|nr:hypothetical protein BB560_000573 [Smittium megazygosporum]